MIPIRQVMEILLADEAWMSPLGDDAVTAVIRFVEDRYPEGSLLPEEAVGRLRRALRLFADWVSAGARFPDLPAAAEGVAALALS